VIILYVLLDRPIDVDAIPQQDSLTGLAAGPPGGTVAVGGDLARVWKSMGRPGAQRAVQDRPRASVKGVMEEEELDEAAEEERERQLRELMGL